MTMTRAMTLSLTACLLLARAALGVTPQECVACDFKRVDPASWTEGAGGAPEKPYLAGDIQFVGGVTRKFEGAIKAVTSPIVDAATGERAVIGTLAQMGEAEALAAVEAAAAAWDRGQGAWPRMAPAARVAAVRAVLDELDTVQRTRIVDMLLWEARALVALRARVYG